MSRHFYAVYWPYGVNTFNFDHEPIGTVVPFDTTKARDAYVAADRFDGNPLKIVVLPVPACFSCWNRRFPCFHDCLEV